MGGSSISHAFFVSIQLHRQTAEAGGAVGDKSKFKKMKTFRIAFLLAVFMSMAGANSYADGFEVDGIAYIYNDGSSGASVSVTSKSGGYSGNVIIPPSVSYGKTYIVTSIGDRAFSNCSGLTSVTIGNSVTTIGGYAFSGCSGLTSVTIPNSVTSIGDNAFSDCSNLTSVYIFDIAAWCNIQFKSNPLSRAQHLYLNNKEVKDLVIPNNVTSISDYAFVGCSCLTSVTIGNSVTSIGRSAASQPSAAVLSLVAAA